MSVIDVALLFLRVGVVSFGGGASVLADLKHELVDQRAAMSEQQFLTAYAIGQATPGPGILFLVPMGFYAAGAPGAAVALVSFLVPPLLLQIFVASQWERLSRSPWIRALDRTLVPLSVGLIGASLYSLGSPLLPIPAQVIGLVLAMLASVVFRLSPFVIVVGAGVLGLLGLM